MKRKGISILLLSMLFCSINTNVTYAEESFVPTLSVTTDESSATLKWSNQPLPSKQISNYDFSSVIPSTYGGYNHPGYGEQSVSNGYARINNTINKGNSSMGVGSAAPGDTSNYYFGDRIKGIFGNNQKLLISMDVLTYGGSATTGIWVCGGREQKLTPSGIYVTQSIGTYDSGTPTKLYVKFLNGTELKDNSVDLGVPGTDDYYKIENYSSLPMFNLGAFHLTSTSNGWVYGYYEVNRIPKAISAGKELNYRFWKNPAPLTTKEINTNGSWENFNFNVDLDTTDMQYFDINTLGVYFNIYNSVRGTYALNDNLKISIANKFWVYRDGSSWTSTYSNSFKDTSATDKANPVLVNNDYSLNSNNGYKNFKCLFNTYDVGTIYRYYVSLRNSADTTNLSTSANTYATVKSGIKELRYRITENPTDNLEGGYAVSSSVKEISSSFDSNLNGILYLHVQSADKAGNVSPLQHIMIDMKNPELNITKNSTTNYTISASDEGSGLDYILCPDGTKKTELSFDYDFTKNGEYTFTAVDKKGNKTVQTLTITDIPEDFVSLEISDNVVNFEEVTDTPNLILNVKTSGPYTLNMVCNDDFKTINNDIIPLDLMSMKIGTGNYIDLAKNKDIIIDESSLTNQSYDLFFKLKSDSLVGYKAGDYKADLSFVLQLK